MNGTPSEQSIICIGSPVVDQIVQVPESFLQDVDGDKGGMELVDAKHLERLPASLPVPPMQAAGGQCGQHRFRPGPPEYAHQDPRDGRRRCSRHLLPRAVQALRR